jgi:hypothetical protein
MKNNIKTDMNLFTTWIHDPAAGEQYPKVQVRFSIGGNIEPENLETLAEDLRATVEEFIALRNFCWGSGMGAAIETINRILRAAAGGKD